MNSLNVADGGNSSQDCEVVGLIKLVQYPVFDSAAAQTVVVDCMYQDIPRPILKAQS
jgi:hypothetical protein